MTFIEVMQANGVSELENFGTFQSEKSHFPACPLTDDFIEVMRANGVGKLENFGILLVRKEPFPACSWTDDIY